MTKMFKFSEQELKDLKAWFGMAIMIAVYVGFWILGVLIYHWVDNPVIIVALIFGLGQLYGVIGAVVYLVFKTRIPDFLKTPPPSLAPTARVEIEEKK